MGKGMQFLKSGLNFSRKPIRQTFYKTLNKTFYLGLMTASTVLLSACGGGGSSASGTPVIGQSQTNVSLTPSPAPSPTPAPTSAASTAPSFTPGIFEDERNFENRCENPRPGTDDLQGSTLIENFWLRSWSQNIYLFFDEIVDRDPAGFDNRLEYFETQRTEATTASGTPRDQFHFSVPTDEFEAVISGDGQGSFGFEFQILESATPREIRIIYVEPNSPAADAGFRRGDIFLEVDDTNIVNGATDDDIDAIDAALFDSVEGQSHRFVVRDAQTNETKTATLTAEIIESSPVNRVEILDDNVGYVLFNTFSPLASEAALFEAFSELSEAGVTELVLDMRYNGGGLLAVASQLAYMIAGDLQTDGHVFEEQVWNSQHPTINPITGRELMPLPFLDESLGFSVREGVDLPALDLERVFILSTSSTCSASEAVINGLRGIGVDVILIGGRTCGKPYGFIPTDNCGETYFTLQFQGNNDAGFGDYADGFSPANSTEAIIGETIPGCEVADDFQAQLGDPEEGLLAAALHYSQEDRCPALTPENAKASKNVKPLIVTSSQKTDQRGDLLANENIKRRLFLEQNRIMTPSPTR